jgi:phosphatidylglycerol:prolipoprotein diacylglycerol transferase
MENFLYWWQHLPSNMNPTIFTIGNFPIRWYGMMYIVAFTVAYLMAKYRLKSEKLPYTEEFLSNAVTWAILGLLLGARVGYVLFYNFDWFLSNPLSIILPFTKVSGSWQFTGISGMSYHGGAIGVFIAWILFCHKEKIQLFKLTDLLIPGVPLAFTFGRLGNFINGELYGRVTDAAIGMYFPAAREVILRHPSQLYEAFFEGIVLFAILWPLRKFKPFPGFISGLYVFGYGFFRFFIEYFREPDEHLGFVFLNFSMGQILCFAMMISAGIIWYIGKYLQKAKID